MPNQPAPENRRIRYLEKLIQSGRTTTANNPRDLLPQEVARFQKELDSLKRHSATRASRTAATPPRRPTA